MWPLSSQCLFFLRLKFIDTSGLCAVQKPILVTTYDSIMRLMIFSLLPLAMSTGILQMIIRDTVEEEVKYCLSMTEVTWCQLAEREAIGFISSVPWQ